MATIFKSISTSMDHIIDKVSPDLITSFMTDLQPLASSGLALYILWLFIPLISGDGNTTASEVMRKTAVWTIIWAFAFNTGGWLTEANTAINTIYNWAAGKTSIFASLDASYIDITEISKSLYKKDTTPFVKVEGSIAMVMVLGSYFLFAFVSVAFLVLSKMVLNLLMLALPLTILAILFPMIKSMFEKWIHIFIDNILTVLFLNITFKIVNAELGTFITKATALAGKPASGSIISLGFDISFTILMMLLFVVIARIMASKLASASMSSEAMSSIPRFKK